MKRRNERLYTIWRAMRERCRREANIGYSKYGGRGITVCDEWQDYEAFKRWAYENGYQDVLSIDRIDVDGNYCPENCRWATMKEQANNKRNNHVVTYKGETHTVAEWAEITGISYRTIISRLNRDKLPPEKVFEKRMLRRDTHTGKFISVKENT